MLRLNLVILLFALALLVSCRDSSRALEHDASDATIASETGGADTTAAVPSDALAVTKALIDGALYDAPSFEANVITQFSTSQQLYLLDTTDIMFVKARLVKDTASYTGYVSKAILPEKE